MPRYFSIPFISFMFIIFFYHFHVFDWSALAKVAGRFIIVDFLTF